MIKFNYDKIPQALKEQKRWCLWKKVKDTKVPINAKNGYGAKTNDENTWVEFDEALSKIEYYNCDGLGFMLGNGFVGVDIDHEIENKELIDEFINTIDSYTEISQSGNGIHIIAKGVLPKGARRKGNIEMYDSVRYFAMTGNCLKNNLRDATDDLETLWKKYVYTEQEETRIFEANENEILSDDDVIQKALASQSGNLVNCLYYGQWEGLYPSQSEADMAFCSILAFWCNRNPKQIDRIFRNSRLYRPKWDEKRGSKTYGELTIASAIAKCKDVYNGSSTQLYNPMTGEVKEKKDYDLSDTGNAQRFVDKFGSNIRYNFDNKCWMIYDGKSWVRDNKQIIKTQADILIEEMKMEAIMEKDKDLQKEMFKNVKRMSSNTGKEAMLKEAMHIGHIPTTNADYDKFDHLLNCNNCIVNLETKELLPHDKKYMMSKNTRIDVDFENKPKRWLQFLNEIFSGNQELIDFIQKAIGYTLTGSTKEECLFQCYGDGANGKSVFLDVLYNMLGDYSLNSQVESILTRNNSNGANSDIARMDGARFIITNEPNENSRFNEGLVKQLVSGNVTTARYLYGSEFEFKPRFKLWIATNYKISVRGTDYGIYRRMRIIPFREKFDSKRADKDLIKKLLAELPQILGWAIEGTLKWQKEGLVSPKIIEQENAIYKQENDTVALFLQDCTKVNANGREKASEVYDEFLKWAKAGNEPLMSRNKFGIELSKLYTKKNVNGYIYYMGFILKKNDESYVYEKQ